MHQRVVRGHRERGCTTGTRRDVLAVGIHKSEQVLQLHHIQQVGHDRKVLAEVQQLAEVHGRVVLLHLAQAATALRLALQHRPG